MPATNNTATILASLTAGQTVIVNLIGSAPYVGLVHDADDNGAVIAHAADKGRILAKGRNSAGELTGNLVLLGTSRSIPTYVVDSIEIRA